MYADPVGAIPLLQFECIGHTRWGAAHPVADGAFAIDYVLDEDFAVTSLSEPAAGVLNGALSAGMAPFAVGERTSILGREFPLFAIRDGQIVVDYDLLYLRHGMLFFGAKHVDGTPFDSPEHRPVLGNRETRSTRAQRASGASPPAWYAAMRAGRDAPK